MSTSMPMEWSALEFAIISPLPAASGMGIRWAFSSLGLGESELRRIGEA